MSANEQTQNTQMSSSSSSSSPDVITNMGLHYVTSSPTHLRLAQEALARQNRMIEYDGRITAKQEIFQIRQNQPSKEAPYAEFWDNSLGWGKAKNIMTVINNSSVVFADDGNFISESHFAQMFMKTKIGNEGRYDEDDESLLGKFNAGSTDSVINMGESARAFHNFNGVVKKTVFELSQYKRDGKITPNIENATTRETGDFVNYMKLMNPEYNLNSGKGTVIKVESLRSKNNQGTVDKVIKFAKGLFRPDAFNQVKMHMFNWLNEEWPDDRKPTAILTPIDTTFGANTVTTKKVNVYQKESNGEVVHTLRNLPQEIFSDYNYKASYEIDVWTLKGDQLQQEKSYFGITEDKERVGFSVYRAGRNITPTPFTWGLSTGASRGRGIRIAIRYPANAFLDEEFGCGTQKTLTDSSWSHFSDSMKELFEKEFNDIQKLVNDLRSQQQKEWIRKYKAKTANIANLDKENAVQEHLAANADFEENFNTKDGLIKKRSGNAYKAWVEFCAACENRITELTSDTEEVQGDTTDNDGGEEEEELEEEELEEDDDQQGDDDDDQQSSDEEEDDQQGSDDDDQQVVLDMQAKLLLMAASEAKTSIVVVEQGSSEEEDDGLASEYEMSDDENQGETLKPIELMADIQTEIRKVFDNLKVRIGGGAGTNEFLETYCSDILSKIDSDKGKYLNED